MSNQPPNDGTGHSAVTNAIVTSTVSSLGDIAAAHGDLAGGFALKSAAPLIGYAAEHWRWLGRGVERIYEFSQRIQERAVEEGVREELKDVKDVIEQAVTVIGGEETEQKRRMIEDIVLNAAKKTKQHGSVLEANHAIDAIKEMSPEVAFVFGALVAELVSSPTGFETTIPDPIPNYGLPEFLHVAAIQEMSPRYRPVGFSSQPAIVMNDAPRRPHHTLLTRPVHIDSEGNPIGEKSFELSDYGKWLASWIVSNPPAPISTES